VCVYASMSPRDDLKIHPGAKSYLEISYAITYIDASMQSNDLVHLI
jgi:hypothetical protein